MTHVLVSYNRHNIKVSPKKALLYAKKLIWGGLQVGVDGVRTDPARIAALVDMGRPETVADVMHFVHALGWCSDKIINFAAIIFLLRTFVREALAGAKRKTKNAAKRIKISDTNYGAEHEAAMEMARDALVNSVRAAYYDPAKTVFVFTDASYRFWSIIITQVPTEQVGLPIGDMDHEFLCCDSGEFKHSQLRWQIGDKEGFPVYLACKKHSVFCTTRSCSASALGT